MICFSKFVLALILVNVIIIPDKETSNSPNLKIAKKEATVWQPPSVIRFYFTATL